MAWSNPTTPNVTDYTTFLQEDVGIPQGILTASANAIAVSLSVAVATVTPDLAAGSCASPVTGLVAVSFYVLACYNLGADRLFNLAPNPPNQTFFSDQREKMRLLEPAVGIVTTASDQGTAGSLMNPEQLRRLTLADLQTLKTPWGRTYLGIAQSYGPTLWGLS